MKSNKNISSAEHSPKCLHILLLALLLCGAAHTLADAQGLRFGPLNRPLAGGLLCPGDSDGDCLDDAMEDQLMELVAPILFFDEDEECNGGLFGNTPEQNAHFPRQDFAQVRPHGDGIRDWSPEGSTIRQVTITYYFLYPHDCASCAGIGGHQGDAERVSFSLASRDLVNWSITGGTYRHHSDEPSRPTGTHIARVSSLPGVGRPVVAVSENSHASFTTYNFLSGLSQLPSFLRKGLERACGPDVNFWADLTGVCEDDCFCEAGTLLECFQEGMSLGRFQLTNPENIGEPERFRIGGSLQSETTTVPTSVGPRIKETVFIALDVGHGENREYWSRYFPDESFAGFCGWECAAENRAGEHCTVSAHGEKKCVGPMWARLDHSPFDISSPVPPTYPNCIEIDDCPPGEACFFGLCEEK